MSDDFKVISEFCCHGKQMVTVRIGNAAHVMSLEEWRKVYGRNHQEKWKLRLIGIDLCHELNIIRKMYLKMGGILCLQGSKIFFGKENLYRTGI